MSLKNDILSELSSGGYVSGQALADKLGVSRNAVWKTVARLKDEGYVIDSVPNKGYRLVHERHTLTKESVLSYMNPRTASSLELFVYDTIDSTNNEAKRMAAGGYSRTALIVAGEQTNGRGRMGREFYSPKNTGVYMSFLFHPHARTADVVSVTTASSMAVVSAIERLTELKPTIKWVNDVYLDGKKICGILTEAVSDFETSVTSSIVVGIGINITTQDFPKDIADTASCLGTWELSHNALVAAVADELLRLAPNGEACAKSYIDEYRRHSMVIGKDINYYRDNVKYTGKAIAIDDDGGLEVLRADGTVEILHSGEVTVRFA